MTHLSDDEIERFLVVRLEPAGEQEAARHLLAGCEICGRRLVEQAPHGRIQRVSESSAGKPAPRSLRDRALTAALRQESRRKMEQEKLARSLDLLRESPRSYDGLPFRHVRALHGRPLVEALLQRSFELRFRDSQAMRWLAYNALKTAESLRPEELSPTQRSDLQAQAWAGLANAYRLNDELAEAAGAFARARAALRQGSGDLALLARLADLEASHLIGQRRLTAAGELLDRVYRLYLRLGDRHLAGRALISRGICCQYQGEHQRSVHVFRKGLSLLHPDRDPTLRPVAQQCIIASLVCCGDSRQAGELFLKSGLRQSLSGDALNLLKIRWIEGRIMAGLDRLPRAESALMEVRADFLDLGQHYSAALVGCDLVEALLRQEKFRPARTVAQASYGTLRDLGIHLEAARLQRYLS